MLEKPNLKDEKLIACLRVEYGLQIIQIAFLPLGGDLSTAVYQAVAEDAMRYFCKLKRGAFDPTTVVLPKFLSEQGLTQIIPPLITHSGHLYAELEEFRLILYPFVEGTNGYEVELSETQWTEFGEALRRIHTTILPPTIIRNIRKERYSAEWRDTCRDIIRRVADETFDDPITLEMVEFLRPKREMILHAIGRAEQLARVMSSRSMEHVVCHSDIHPGNLFVDAAGTLFIVDWDYPLLAPKERDLMFIGGGQGFMPSIAEREERLFYRGYGPSQVDPIALTYYRYERGITDISVECERILSDRLDTPDRAQALEILQLYFLPGCTIEMAHASDQTWSNQ